MEAFRLDAWNVLPYAYPLMGPVANVAPAHLELHHGVVDAHERAQSVVAVLAAFDFDSPDDLLPKRVIETLVAARRDAVGVRELRLPEGCGEVLVIGNCYVPGGKHATACLARLQMATVDKEIYVSGDRFWNGSESTEPQPFRAMPIDLPHAFGGPGSKRNPAGKGLAPFEIEGKRVYPWPNIQESARLIMAPGDTTPLAGLGPLPERAAADQMLAAPLAGGETFLLENMHPEVPELRGSLPRIVCRCFAARGAELTEVALAFETVWLFPTERRGVAVYRGLLPSGDEAGSWLAAFEDLDDPKSADHYRAAWQRRRAGEASNDADLVPSRIDPASPAASAPGPGDALRARVEQKRAELAEELQAQAAKAMDEARARIVAMGLDPEEHLPETLPEPSEPPPAPSLAEMQAQMAVQRAKIEQQLVEQLEGSGIDVDTALAQEQVAGPPARFSAAAHLEGMREALARAEALEQPMDEARAKLEDPAFAAELSAAEATFEIHYRRTAHHHPPFQLADEAAAALREEVIRARGAGESLAGRDLAGADLRGLDLEGANLSGALLECAQLASAKLAQADLSRAVLAHADLTGTDLWQCRLVDANLGGAKLVRAHLRDADLSGAILADADLDEVDREGATWTADPTGVRAMMTELRASSPPTDSPEPT